MANDVINIPTYKKEGFTPYKAIITKANNGLLVRNCLKPRWWWTLVDKEE
jgi:hypothetical protein